MDAENVAMNCDENAPTTPVAKPFPQKGKRLSAQSPFSAASPQQRIPAKVLKEQNRQRFNLYEADPNIEQTFCEQTMLEDVTKETLQINSMEEEAATNEQQNSAEAITLLDKIAAEELDKTLEAPAQPGEFSLEAEIEASLGKSETAEEVIEEPENEKVKTLEEKKAALPSLADELGFLNNSKVQEAKFEVDEIQYNASGSEEVKEKEEMSPIEFTEEADKNSEEVEASNEPEMPSESSGDEAKEENTKFTSVLQELLASLEKNSQQISQNSEEMEKEVTSTVEEDILPKEFSLEDELAAAISAQETVEVTEVTSSSDEIITEESVFEEEPKSIEVQTTLEDELNFAEKTQQEAVTSTKDDEQKEADKTLQGEEIEATEAPEQMADEIVSMDTSKIETSQMNLTNELNFSGNNTFPPTESTLAREVSNLEEPDLSSIPANDTEEINEIEDSIAELPSKKDFSFIAQPKNPMLSESLMEFVLTENKVEYEMKTEEAQEQLQTRISELENELTLAQRERDDYKFIFEENTKKHKDAVKSLTQRCNELEMEAESLRQKGLNESQIVNLESLGERMDTLMKEYETQTQRCEQLERENEALSLIKKESEAQKEQLEEAQKTIEVQKAELELAVINHETLQASMEELKAEKETISQSLAQKEELQHSLAESKQQLEELQTIMQEINVQKAELSEKVVALTSALEIAQMEAERMKRSSVSNEDIIEQLKTESDELKESLAQANHKKLQLQQSLDSMESQYNEDFQQATATSNKLTALEAELEEMKRKEVVHIAKAEELEQEVSSLRESLSQANQKSEEQEKMLKELREDFEHKTSDSNKLIALESELIEMKEKEKEQLTKVEILEQEVSSLKESLLQANYKNEKDEALLKELREQSTDLEIRTAEFKKLEAELNELKKRETDQLGKVEGLELENNSLKESLAQVEHEKKQLEVTLKTLEEQQNEQLEQTTAVSTKIETFEAELKKIREREAEHIGANQQLVEENTSLKENLTNLEERVFELTETATKSQEELSVLERALEEAKKTSTEATELIKTVSELEEKVEGLTTELYTSSANILEAQKKEAEAMMELKSKTEELSEIKLQLGNTSNNYLNAQKEIDALKGQILELEGQKSLINQSEMDALKTHKEELEARCQKLEAIVEEMKLEAEMVRKSNNLTLGVLGEKVESLMTQNDGLKKEIQELSQANSTLKEALSNQKEQEQKTVRIQVNQESKEFFEKKIVELKARVQDLEMNLEEQTKDAQKAWKMCDEMDDLEAEYKQKLSQASDEINRLKIKAGEIQTSEALLNVFHRNQKELPPGSVNNSIEEAEEFHSPSGSMTSPVSLAQEATPERTYLGGGAEKTVMDHIDKSPVRKNTSCRQQ